MILRGICITMGCIGDVLKASGLLDPRWANFCTSCPFSHISSFVSPEKHFSGLPDKSEPVRRRKFLKWFNAEYARKASNITLEYSHVSYSRDPQHSFAQLNHAEPPPACAIMIRDASTIPKA